MKTNIPNLKNRMQLLDALMRSLADALPRTMGEFNEDSFCEAIASILEVHAESIRPEAKHKAIGFVRPIAKYHGVPRTANDEGRIQR